MVKKNTLAIYLGMLGIFSPFLAYAQTQENFIVQVVSAIEGIMTALFPIATALAILAVGYNLAKFLAAQDVADKSLFKTGIINSLIALFVVFTLFGSVSVLARTLGIPSLGQSITTASPEALQSIGGGGAAQTIRDYALGVARFASQRILPIMSAGAVLVFFGNIIISMMQSDSETERANLNAYLRWGVFAIFIIFTLFGLVNIITGTLFGTGGFIPQFPTN